MIGQAPPDVAIRASRVARVAIERYPRVALILLVVSLSLAGLAGTPPVDRDEPQFAQPAKQMLASGNFIDIRFQDAPLAQKPIMTYWLEAASAAIFGGANRAPIWAYRLPSVLGVLCATLLSFDLAATLFGHDAALPAAFLVATSALVQSQAHQARADALLLAETTALMLPLARVWLAEGSAPLPRERTLAALFWAAMAAAILTKGPVAPALIVPAVAALVWQRRSASWLQRLHPAWGVPLFLLLLLPWPVLVIALHGPSLFLHAWRTDVYPKMISGQESHGAPPLSYLLTSPLTLWPASLLLPSAVQLAWRRRRAAAVRLCAAVILPGWVLFEVAPTKLPHYIMPFVPPLAALMAASCCSPGAPSIVSRLGVALFLPGTAAVAGAIVLGPWWLGPGLGPESILWSAALLCAAAWAASAAWRGRLARAAGAATLCGIVGLLGVFGFALPRLDRLWVAERAVQAARAVVPAPAAVVVVGYDEPSLVFLLGTDTRFDSATAAAEALRTSAAAAAIVSGKSAAAFLAAAHARRMDVRRIADVRGIDPIHGRPVELGVWKEISYSSAARAAPRAPSGRTPG